MCLHLHVVSYDRCSLTAYYKLSDCTQHPKDSLLSHDFSLGTGWSVRSNQSATYSLKDDSTQNLSEDELHHIKRIMKRAEFVEDVEKDRVG